MKKQRGLGGSLPTALSTCAPLSFRAVNRKDAPDYRAGLQRHHLLPRQLVSRRCFGRFLEGLGWDRVRLHDFRFNGLLLPANDEEVLRTGLPLHRGPHRIYSELVIERVAQIERGWITGQRCHAERASEEALMRLHLLQRALRQKLLKNEQGRALLNRYDPIGTGRNFTDLDAMAEAIWGASAPAPMSQDR